MDEVTAFVLENWDRIQEMKRAEAQVRGGFRDLLVGDLRSYLLKQDWFTDDDLWFNGVEDEFFWVQRRRWDEKAGGTGSVAPGFFLYGLGLESLLAVSEEDRSSLGFYAPLEKGGWRSKVKKSCRELRAASKGRYTHDDDEHLQVGLRRFGPPEFIGGGGAISSIAADLRALIAEVTPLVDEAMGTIPAPVPSGRKKRVSS